jgi:DNA-binding transcriptional MerR regulator
MSHVDTKLHKEVWLRSAECAKQTGLTIRALQVYERYGLVQAKRMSNGYRCYGMRELERLNMITALKVLGMSLAQIRDIVQSREPSLERMLEVQVQAWKAKQVDAERGVMLAQTALARVRSQQSLSIHALCQLIQGFESMSDQMSVLQYVVDETLTSEEQKALTEFMTNNVDLEQVRAQMQGEMAIFKQLNALMELGTPPDAPTVQELLADRNRLTLRFGKDARTLKAIEWNRAIGVKFYSIESRAMKKMHSRSQSEQHLDAHTSRNLLGYFIEANKRSAWAEPTQRLIADARSHMTIDSDPTSKEAVDLARRFRDIYTQYSLSDPEVAAKLIPYWDAIFGEWPSWLGEENRSTWLFLAEAVVASRGPGSC